MTLPLPECIHEFARLNPQPTGMSSGLGGNSFLIQGNNEGCDLLINFFKIK
jgi:hypothetical protein